MARPRAALLRRVVAMVVCLLVLTSVALAQETTAPNSSTPLKKRNERPASALPPASEPYDTISVDRMAAECVRLETEAGVIEIEMLAESAPETVRNFLNLVAIGAFDTTTFSRVVKGFVIQGGNLATRQTLTPQLAERANRTIADEPNNIKHVRGIVSMALPGRPNAATTHFFILVGDAPHLDGKFSAFGRVVRGMEVADAINQGSVSGDKPDKPVRITHATIYACPHQPEPATEP